MHRAIGVGHALDELVAGELGEVVSGSIPDRVSAQDITIAKLVGIGAQDLSAVKVAG